MLQSCLWAAYSPQEQQLSSLGLLSFAATLGLHRPLNLPVVSRIGGCLLLLTPLLWPEIPKGGTRCDRVQGTSLPRQSQAVFCPSATSEASERVIPPALGCHEIMHIEDCCSFCCSLGRSHCITQSTTYGFSHFSGFLPQQSGRQAMYTGIKHPRNTTESSKPDPWYRLLWKDRAVHCFVLLCSLLSDIS